MNSSMMNAAGGAGLYKVIAAARLPETAPEGAILVMTETPMPAFSMRTSVSQIEAPRTGEVCFVCGSGGSLVCLDKKQRYATAIFAAYQYDGEEWVSVPWYVREDGAWATPQMTLYSPGNVHSENTGGWSSLSGSGVTFAGGYIQFRPERSGYSGPTYVCAASVKKVDVTRFSRMFADVKWIGGNNDPNNNNTGIGLGNSRVTYYQGVKSTSVTAGAGGSRIELDITELTGEYYILAGVGGGNNSSYDLVAFYDIWLA